MQFTPTQKRAICWGSLAVLVSLVILLLSPVLTSFALAMGAVVYGLRQFIKNLCWTRRLVGEQIGLRQLDAICVWFAFEQLFRVLPTLIALLVRSFFPAAERRAHTYSLSNQLYQTGGQ